MLMAALKSRFTNTIHLLPLTEFIYAKILRARALCATKESPASRRACIFSRLSILFFVVVVTCSSSLSGRREGDYFHFPGAWQ